MEQHGSVLAADVTAELDEAGEGNVAALLQVDTILFGICPACVVEESPEDFFVKRGQRVLVYTLLRDLKRSREIVQSKAVKIRNLGLVLQSTHNDLSYALNGGFGCNGLRVMLADASDDPGGTFPHLGMGVLRKT